MGDTSREDHKWPVRDAACADCRSITLSDTGCVASGKHRVCSLSDEKERERLKTEVWGPPSLRRRAKAVGKAGATGVGAGTFLETCGGCDAALFEGEAAIAIGGIILLMIVFVLAYLLIAAIIRYIDKRRQTLKPSGAIAKGARLGHATGMVGTVASVTALLSPLSKEKCVGYGLLFTRRRGWSRRAAMLRDTLTCGFELKLDSGDTVRIPAGGIVLDMQHSVEIDPDTATLEEYLLAIDPLGHKSSEEYALFPHDRIDELLIRIGDRVEIRSPMRTIVDTEAVATGYRESAATILVPQGPPHLRICPNSATSS